MEVNVWRKLCHAKTIQRKVGKVILFLGTAILLSGRARFKARKVNRDKERQYIMASGSIFQKDITILNLTG